MPQRRKNEKFSEYIKANAIQITVEIVGVLVVIVNLFITTKLAPIAQNLAITQNKVSAIETSLDNHEAQEIKKTEFEDFKKSILDSLKELREKIDDINKYLRK